MPLLPEKLAAGAFSVKGLKKFDPAEKKLDQLKL
ncbi:hypothetical protein SAMN05444266_101160 [Chitinophaga jiangningensis]|uniref:Uncharacterized protein n=1 Tax=Chitinophaga jiangningensis TaxID=1419482 RepID=A0A1M6VCY3_9BACT|nr:hypothetical protein SAMN05444266_101160 [Chitinophaga jiangningensis]